VDRWSRRAVERWTVDQRTTERSGGRPRGERTWAPGGGRPSGGAWAPGGGGYRLGFLGLGCCLLVCRSLESGCQAPSPSRPSLFGLHDFTAADPAQGDKDSTFHTFIAHGPRPTGLENKIWVHMSYTQRVTDMDSLYPYPRNYYPRIVYSNHTRTRGYENPPYPYPTGK
jgi:hypothetical protein